jgi:hypothetical protein
MNPERVPAASRSQASAASFNERVFKIVIDSLHGKEIRINNNGTYDHCQCRMVGRALHINDVEVKSVPAFMAQRGFKNTKTYKQFLDVFHEGNWTSLLLYADIISSEDGRCLGMIASAAQEKLKDNNIKTKAEFHDHPYFRYKIETDILRGVICPLLRVCDTVPVGEMRRQSVASESATEYINSMTVHVRNGSRSVRQPFFSASKNVDVIKYHSCAFLKPVILIDQELVKSRAFYFGGPPGRVLFGDNGAGPVRNFAEFSDEVLIDEFIAEAEYSIVEAQFKLRHEVKSCEGFSVPAIEVLKSFTMLPLKADRGGVLRLTNPAGGAYVWKVGNCKGHGSDSHICNEFIANVLYRAMGVPVPRAVLRMYRVDLTAVQAGKKVDIYSGDVYVLIHEFIEGEKAMLDSQDDVKALAAHCIADIILCNHDVLGPNNLDNIIMRDGDAYRIDAGAALFAKPDGSLKTNFAVSQRKAVDVRKDFITYFSFKTAECKRILQYLMLNPRALPNRVEAMKRTFQKSISWFTVKGGFKPPMWENTLSLIKSRLESLLTLEDPSAFWKETVQLNCAKRMEAAAEVVDEPPAPPADAVDDHAPDERNIEIRGVKKKKVDKDIERIDVTSKSQSEYARLSPFTAFRNKRGAAAFKVPFMPNVRSYSVEGIWQGLKVFEKDEVDTRKFFIDTGESLKRTTKKYGAVLGHFAGDNQPLLGYVEARKQIYVPCYEHMLKTFCVNEMAKLFELHLQKDIVLLDYYTNDDVANEATPLSHASLVKKRLHEMFAERYPQSRGTGRSVTGTDGGGGGAGDTAGPAAPASRKRKARAAAPRSKAAKKADRAGSAVSASSVENAPSSSDVPQAAAAASTVSTLWEMPMPVD